MNTKKPDAEILLREVLTSLAQLPATDLWVVYETINDLKSKDHPEQPRTPDEILARAKTRAAEMRQLPHAEAVQRFIDATEQIRAEAVAKGIAIEGDCHVRH